MKKIHKDILKTPQRKVLIENFFSLSFLQATNYVLPLITLPYLVRVLGPARYGLIAFALAFTQYFIMLTDYGFTFSAVRHVSVNRDNKEKVSEIFSSVFLIKILIMISCFLILLCVLLIVPKFKRDLWVYIFSFGLVVGNALMPVWFLQGIERMKLIAVLNFISKFIFTSAIFIFIRNENDYIYVPLLNSAGYLVAGIIGILLIFSYFKIRFIAPSLKSILDQIKQGGHIFISRISISLYTTTNVFLLGLFTNDTIVGYYAAGEKIIRTIITMFEPIFQSLYPFISKIAAESKDRTLKVLRQLFRFTLAVSVSLFLLILIFSKYVVLFILGEKFNNSAIIVQILTPLLIIVPAAGIFANLTLLPFKLDKFFSQIYIAGAIINIFILFVLLYVFNLGGIGAAASNLITETIVTISMFFVLKKRDLNIIYENR